MADIEYSGAYDAQGSEHAQGGGFGRLVNIAGGLASIALVAGVGIWGYKLLMRDVSGVPVVRALEGPMRIQPEDPGGRQADHQGLAVNAVAAQGTAAKPAERLMLAPKPVSLSDEDKPMGELIKASAQSKSEETSESVDDLVAKLVKGATPIEGVLADETESAEIVQPEPLAALDADDLIEAEPAVLTGPGLPQSLRPMVRPARTERRTAPAPAVASETTEVAADTLPAGTRLAQLGAFESPEVAREEWARLNVKFEDYLEDKDRVIQKAESGGRTFYRLRAMGFDDLNDARRFCSVLVAENADCIPVTTR